MTQTSLYNTGGIPEFTEPETLADARSRIAELRLAVMSINDQITYQQAAGSVEPSWLRKATTSRRFKSFELERLENWLVANVSLNEHIVAAVLGDYTEDEWREIVATAREALNRVSGV